MRWYRRKIVHHDADVQAEIEHRIAAELDPAAMPKPLTFMGVPVTWVEWTVPPEGEDVDWSKLRMVPPPIPFSTIIKPGGI